MLKTMTVQHHMQPKILQNICSPIPITPLVNVTELMSGSNPTQIYTLEAENSTNKVTPKKYNNNNKKFTGNDKDGEKNVLKYEESTARTYMSI